MTRQRLQDITTGAVWAALLACLAALVWWAWRMPDGTAVEIPQHTEQAPAVDWSPGLFPPTVLLVEIPYRQPEVGRVVLVG